MSEYEKWVETYKKNINKENGFYTNTQAKQTKPLSEDEIKAIENSVKYSELALSNDEYMLKFARAIEERHGIK